MKTEFYIKKYSEGYSCREIAEMPETHISRTTIWKVLKENGVALKKSQTKFGKLGKSKERVKQEVFDRWKCFDTFEEMERHFEEKGMRKSWLGERKKCLN